MLFYCPPSLFFHNIKSPRHWCLSLQSPRDHLWCMVSAETENVPCKTLQNHSLFINTYCPALCRCAAESILVMIIKRQSSHHSQYRYIRRLNIKVNKVLQASWYTIYTALVCNSLTSSELHYCSGVTGMNILSSSFVCSALTQTLAPLTSTVKWYWSLTNKCISCWYCFIHPRAQKKLLTHSTAIG